MAFHFTNTDKIRPTIPTHRPAIRELFDNTYGTWASISPDERKTFIDWLKGSDKTENDPNSNNVEAMAKQNADTNPDITGGESAIALVNPSDLNWEKLGDGESDR